ncbi:MAG TPA: four helix bundle protein, partial [bacterium]|nr:four helix bundle protein [bacterium]
MAKSIVQEKSFKFALKVIGLFDRLQKNNEYILSKQLLRSGTSIGANVEEALAAQTRRDFHMKMTVASKEARETRYWLRLLQESQLVKVELTEYLQMVEELV